MDFEICTDSIDGAIIASTLGVKRVELCASLNEGGTTPSYGMIEACVRESNSEIHTMIRPRSGSFVYNEKELLIMERNIIAAAHAGAKGVVFGVLDSNNKLDIQNNLFLMEAAIDNGLQTTFHRAFDLCSNPVRSIEDLINMGFRRILTSGQHEKAIDGIPNILDYVKAANGKIEIMAGSGITPENAKIISETGVNALHFTARMLNEQSQNLMMGSMYTVDENKIQSIMSIFK